MTSAPKAIRFATSEGTAVEILRTGKVQRDGTAYFRITRDGPGTSHCLYYTWADRAWIVSTVESNGVTIVRRAA